MIGMNNAQVFRALNCDAVLRTARTLADRNGRLTIAMLHATLPHLTLADLHGYLLALQDVGDVVLYRQDSPRALTQADHDAALWVGAGAGRAPRHIVYVI